AKALLVVLFFMHAWQSTRLVWLVGFAGLTWLAILLGLTLTDYLSRGWSPRSEASKLWRFPAKPSGRQLASAFTSENRYTLQRQTQLSPERLYWNRCTKD